MWRKDFLLHGNISGKLYRFFFAFDWIYFTQCLTSFSTINLFLCIYAWFLILFQFTLRRFSLSTHLLMCLSLETLNTHHKDYLTYSGGTDRPGELCYNFSISNDLTQLVNFPGHTSDWDSHSSALLDLFLSSDTSISSTKAFPDWETLIILLSQFLLTFCQTQNVMHRFVI